MSLCRALTKLVLRMHRLVGLGSFWGVLRHLFSGQVWDYALKCLGVVASLLAVQYVFKGGREDQVAGEEKSNVNSETAEPHREDTTDTLQNTQEDVQEDAHGDAQEDVQVDAQEDVLEDVHDVQEDVRGDAQGDVQEDVQEDLQGDAQGDVQEDVQVDAQEDVQDVQEVVRGDAQEDVQDVQEVVRGDAQGDVQEDLQGDVLEDLQGDVQEDLQGDVQEDLRGDVQEDLQGDAQEDEFEDFTFHDRYFEHDYECDCDSTWDTDSEENALGGQNERTKVFKAHSYKFERFKAAARDLQNYRHNYPIRPFRCWNYQDSDKAEYPNLDFYLGKLPSSPDDVYIGDFHTMWRGQYDILESVHTYIQWLFPLQEQGVNPEAPTLNKEEIQEFCQNDIARKNLLESYKLMLDFYGIELSDEVTGEVKRAANYKGRFRNLNTHTHNNLRITRMLKCMGTLGFKHYQAPLVHFFLEETLINGELPRVKDSVLNYYLFTVCDKQERRSLLNFAYLNFDKREEFVWCPKKIQMKWEKQNSTFKM